MKKEKFWPLDFDPEGEIYENLAWDLPGYRHRTRKRDARKDALQSVRTGEEVR